MASARHPHTDQLDIADNNTIQKKKKQKKKTQNQKITEAQKSFGALNFRAEPQDSCHKTEQRKTKKSRKTSKKRHPSSQLSSQQDDDSEQLDECSDYFRMDPSQPETTTTETLTAPQQDKTDDYSMCQDAGQSSAQMCLSLSYRVPSCVVSKASIFVFDSD